jgi:hypothetical protein
MVNKLCHARPKRGPLPQVSSRNDRSTRYRCLVAKYNCALSCAARDDTLLSEHTLMVLDPRKKNDQDDLSPEMAVSTVAPSPVVEPQATRLLPAGFEEVDVTILKWIAAEARR